MPAGTLRVGAIALSPVFAGEWCSVCALPSVVVGTFATTINSEPMGVMHVRRCAECGLEC